VKDGWYIVEDFVTKERSVVQVQTHKCLKEPIWIYGIRYDNAHTPEQFHKYWTIIRPLDLGDPS